MKSSHTCPKCSHHEILFFPQIADRDDRDQVRPLVAHVRHFDWKEDDEIGVIQAYVCRSCGYTELYTNEPDKIPMQKVPGTKLLKKGAPRSSAKPPREPK